MSNSLVGEIEDFLDGTPLDAAGINRNDDGLLYGLQVGIGKDRKDEMLRKAASLLMIAKEEIGNNIDSIADLKNEILNLNGGNDEGFN